MPICIKQHRYSCTLEMLHIKFVESTEPYLFETVDDRLTTNDGRGRSFYSISYNPTLHIDYKLKSLFIYTDLKLFQLFSTPLIIELLKKNSSADDGLMLAKTKKKKKLKVKVTNIPS